MQDIIDYTKLITEDIMKIGGSLQGANLGKEFGAYLVLKDDWQIGLEFEHKPHKV